MPSSCRSLRPSRAGGNADGERRTWPGGPPRAGQALMLGARAKALIDGRLAPSIDDVVALAGTCPSAPHGADLRARADGKSVGDVIAHLKGLHRLMARAPYKLIAWPSRSDGASLALPPACAGREDRRHGDPGVHGRRAAGPGETFWQYRPYGPEHDPAHRLAQVGAGRPRLHPRAREGKRQPALGLVQHRPTDELPFASRFRNQTRPRSSSGAGIGKPRFAGP